MSGIEFVSVVSEVTGGQFKFEKWVGKLYDALQSCGKYHTFEELAFEAKSFQKLKRISSRGISDGIFEKTIGAETKETVRRFYQLLEVGLTCLLDNDRERFRVEFLDSGAQSYENIIGLIDDFATVKDFLLQSRDSARQGRQRLD